MKVKKRMLELIPALKGAIIEMRMMDLIYIVASEKTIMKYAKDKISLTCENIEDILASLQPFFSISSSTDYNQCYVETENRSILIPMKWSMSSDMVEWLSEYVQICTYKKTVIFSMI